MSVFADHFTRATISKKDAELGFKVIHCDELETDGAARVAQRILERVADNPLYLSIDIDVLDPAFAPEPAPQK